MAADFISVDTSKQHGTRLVRLANLVQEAANLAEDLNDNAGHMWDTGPVYTQLKTEFGLSSDGDAAAVLSLLTNAATDLAGSNLASLVARVANQ